MKKILVLTDFSKNASHAAESATWLAEKLHTSLLLWNCNPKVPVMPGYLGGTLWAKTLAGSVESKDKFKLITQELEDFISNTGGDYKPQLLTRYKEGPFQEELAKQLREEAFELIVMGATKDCAFEHIFTSSHTYNVIETANCPVLIVPNRATLCQLDKIVFATDFEPEDLIAIRYLGKLSQTVGFKIEVVHVIVNEEDQPERTQKEITFNEQLAKLKSPAITFKEINGKDVVVRLNHISKQTKADMLAMTHHHYSFFKKLFSQSITKKELAHQKIPLLVFPLNY